MGVRYIQNAKGVNPSTIYFTDRPARLAGHLLTTRFLPLWDEGKDRFLRDPPNATLSPFPEANWRAVSSRLPQIARSHCASPRDFRCRWRMRFTSAMVSGCR